MPVAAVIACMPLDEDSESTLHRVHRTIELTGPALNVSAACASSNFALEIARTWLRNGLVDACVAGGCEMAVTPIGLATFGNLRALSAAEPRPDAGFAPV